MTALLQADIADPSIWEMIATSSWVAKAVAVWSTSLLDMALGLKGVIGDFLADALCESGW